MRRSPMWVRTSAPCNCSAQVLAVVGGVGVGGGAWVAVAVAVAVGEGIGVGDWAAEEPPQPASAKIRAKSARKVVRSWMFIVNLRAGHLPHAWGWEGAPALLSDSGTHLRAARADHSGC